MVVVSGSPWAKKVALIVISINLVFWWWCFSVPGSDDLKPPKPSRFETDQLPNLPDPKELEEKEAAKLAAAEKAAKAAREEADPKVGKNGLKTYRSWSNFELIRPRNDKTFLFRRFKSSPHKPPHVEWNPNGGELSKGYVFITPQSTGEETGLVQAGSFIMKQNAELVYAHDEAPFDSEGLRVQNINNEQFLTLWRGTRKGAHGFGQAMIMNSQYEKTIIHLDAIISNKFGKKFKGQLDFHEQELTTRGTILVTAYNTTAFNLTQMGGTGEGYVSDSMFFEIDIETEEILFSWSALDHFWPEDSMLPLITESGNGTATSPYDFFHLNSVQAINHDSFLISSRNFWSVYLISRSNGKVLWELRGNTKGGSFGGIPPHGRFRWQNHVRALEADKNGMIVSMFDNHNSPEDLGQTNSRGLVLKVNLPPKKDQRPEVIRILSPDRGKVSPNDGSYQLFLSNGNSFMSWGAGGVVHEYGPAGGQDLRWQARFGYDETIRSYRAFKDVWTGTPMSWAPALVLEKTEDSVLGYVSWNGATDIESYNVYQYEPGSPATPLGKAAALGFETAFDLGSKFNLTSCILVAAVRDGQELRQSNVGCLQGRTFVSTFVDSNGMAQGDSAVEESFVQKVMRLFGARGELAQTGMDE
ncbi:hypothetical protein NW752_007338 [Fusarium irregulare]|uniref:ASST-domain-containing protein n=1 Tax=Fusarium irregulare TaxID=2494466 RepID=A0A9W8PLZ0_9HYPO|nr:hypothetical protein NW766_007762 [Fusarium irregulare]KAJ4014570.1 hypothetical protein NW752_007338 [Fusarium irregulare]